MRQEVQTIKSSLYIYQAKHCKKCGSQVPHFSNASPLERNFKQLQNNENCSVENGAKR